MMSTNKRILIVRPDRIGDVVLSTGLPREIKKSFPDSFVAVMVRSYTKDIYLNNPNVDEILLVEETANSIKSFFRKVWEIRKYKFTHSLTLLPTERLNYLLFLAAIPYRVGVSHKLYQFLTFTKYVSRNKYNPLRHEADYCMDLARKIGVVPDSFKPEIHLSESEKEEVKSLRNCIKNNKKYIIGIHSTSGNSSPNIPVAEYVKLINELNAIPDLQIVVTDNIVPDEIKNNCEVPFINTGKNLRQSILNFAALDYLISASTGPMHIASALNIRTVAMFCPLTACSPKLWGPLGGESRIILPDDDYCRNKCPGDPKVCKFEGDGGIDSKKVLRELKSFISS
jgi:heptosyltransferase III